MAIDTVVEEVADNLEEMAEATRRINTKSIGFVAGGFAVGVVVGFYFGRKLMKEKLRAEAFAESEVEVAKIRHDYQRRLAAVEKPPVEQIIEEKGYERPLPAPVPGVYEPPAVVVAPIIVERDVHDKNHDWNYAAEMQKRVEGEPYVIHQDEYMNQETSYRQQTMTYYAADDVLVDESNGHPLPHADIVVGLNNLQFGHGTDDPDVVFVRNDKMQLEMEICRVPDSYEQEVLGILPDDDSETESD